MVKGVQFFTMNEGQQTSTIIALQLTQASSHRVLRLTGGFGNMNPADGEKGIQLLTDALATFSGSLLFGGTRVVRGSNPTVVYPTLAEVPGKLAKTMVGGKKIVVLGVVPRTDVFRLVPELGMVISESPDNDQITIIHPDQEICLQVQKSVDDLSCWDAEWRECMRIVNDLVTYAKWRQVLLVWNGGGVTKREVLAWASHGWPVLLIKGSGRTADEFAGDQNWLQQHPSVLVAEANVLAIRSALEAIDII